MYASLGEAATPSDTTKTCAVNIGNYLFLLYQYLLSMVGYSRWLQKVALNLLDEPATTALVEQFSIGDHAGICVWISLWNKMLL